MKATEAADRIARALQQRMPNIMEQSNEWGMIQQDIEEEKAEWIRLVKTEIFDCLLEMQREEIATIQRKKGFPEGYIQLAGAKGDAET